MCGGSNPVDDLFSSAGDALADLDDTVAETIPGGWMTAARLAMMANGVHCNWGGYDFELCFCFLCHDLILLLSGVTK